VGNTHTTMAQFNKSMRSFFESKRDTRIAQDQRNSQFPIPKIPKYSLRNYEIWRDL